MTSDGSSARASADRGRPSNSGISPNRSPRSIRAITDSRPSIDRLAMAMRPDTTTNSSVGLVALGEQHVAPVERAHRRGRRRWRRSRRAQIGEQLDGGEQVSIDHAAMLSGPWGLRGRGHASAPVDRPSVGAVGSGRAAICGRRAPIPTLEGIRSSVLRFGSTMSFDVGDKVVYPHHGAAVIERREMKVAFGEEKEYLVLRLAYGDLTADGARPTTPTRSGCATSSTTKRSRRCSPCCARRRRGCRPTGRGASRTTSRS